MPPESASPVVKATEVLLVWKEPVHPWRRLVHGATDIGLFAGDQTGEGRSEDPEFF